MCALNHPRRIFFEKQKKMPRVTAFTLALVLTLGACRTVEAPPTGTGSSKQLMVVTAEARHDVAFHDGALSPDIAGRHALDRFLGDRRADERFTIIIPDTTAGGKRGASVTALLRSRGIPKARIHIHQGTLGAADAPGRGGSAVTVIARRYTVTAPACPDWSRPLARNDANLPTSNFGCSTAINLGAMVADPADLAGGRDPGPDDGAGAVRSVQLWRAGKVAEPADPTAED